MNSIFTKDIVQMVEDMAHIIIENEVYFCELDSIAGDGDFGMSISKGFKKLKENWNELNQETIGTFLNDCSEIISEHCGGASGPIWGSAFRGASKSTEDKTELSMSEFAEMMASASALIQKRGKAQEGDKTLLDALLPCVRSLSESAEQARTVAEALNLGAEEAADGAEKTKLMVASRGRASYVGERSLEHPDAGAMALGVIFHYVADQYKAR